MGKIVKRGTSKAAARTRRHSRLRKTLTGTTGNAVRKLLARFGRTYGGGGPEGVA